MATANKTAVDALKNAAAAADLTKKAQKREADAKEQRDTQARLGDEARTERDHLAGTVSKLEQDGIRFRAEYAGLTLQFQDLQMRHEKEWSPWTWMAVGAGGAVVTWAVVNFVLVPRL